VAREGKITKNGEIIRSRRAFDDLLIEKSKARGKLLNFYPELIGSPIA
jgi:hypothetical protein